MGLSALLLALGASVAPAADELPELPRPHPSDVAFPIQERFRGWPPEGLLTRPYWLPWVPSTFDRAVLHGRPLLLVMVTRESRASQRMMHETLSSPEVLRAINDGYVPLLADADRRPDLRERYQTGTWPVIAFLLPNGYPMLSQANDLGVARPITTGWVGVEPMLFLLREGVKYYDLAPARLVRAAEEWVERETPAPPTPGAVNPGVSDLVAAWLIGSADRSAGGFGAAPKYPLPGLYEYAALRSARGEPALESHARLTLAKLVAGPLYDQRDGGVHRIALEPNWGSIQYEKRLATNAYLLRDLVFACRSEPSPALREAVAGTARFLVSVLGRPQGGFHLSQVADPGSPDGGGYWRGERDEAPPRHPLVLAGPNAIAGAALLRAAALLGDDADPALEPAARAALDLVLERAYRRGRGVDHVIDPNPGSHRFLVTQADTAFGLVDAHESTGDPRYLEAAHDVFGFAFANLRASGSRLLLDHLPGPRRLGLTRNDRRPLRPNVRLARAGLRLWHLTGDQDYFRAALGLLGAVSGDLAAFRLHAILPALAVEEAIAPPLRIVVRGAPDHPAARRLRRAAENLPWPWTVIATEADWKEPELLVLYEDRRDIVKNPLRLPEVARSLTASAGPREERR